MKEAEILRQQPFRGILRINSVESLAGKSAISGETFKVTSTDGRSYKLRYCTSLRQAWRIERNVKLFPKAFPQFYGREGRYVLFDWIDGTTLAKPVAPEICYQIGKLAGEVHSLEDIDKRKKVDSYFVSILQKIQQANLFTREIIAKIQLKYEQLKKNLKFDVILELNDVHPGNFIADKMQRIYYVDEDGFGHKVKGLGLAKPILVGWMKTREQQDAFWRGYNEHHSSDYFDRDYQQFILFLQLVRTISTRLKTGADFSKEKERLLSLL